MRTNSTIEPTAFREAMSRFAAAVHIIATDGPHGRRGVTATSVVSVSDRPASLLVCLNTSNAANERFVGNGCFSVNLLGAGGEDLARAFSGEGALTPDARFALGAWMRLETGAPVLADGLVSCDCRLLDARVIATHHVLVGEVVALRFGPPDASLLYRDRAYHRL